MTLAVLQLLEENETLDEAAVDRFVAARESPIVEGPSVTFLWRGEADQVLLRHFVYGLPTAQAFHRVGGTSLWYFVLELPHGSRMEYKLEVVRGRERRLVRDPLNPHRAYDPYGSNSVCHGSGYVRPEWVDADPEARPGELIETEVQSGVLGGVQPLTVYLPARMRETRTYPLLVVLDGGDYLRYASLRTVLDNLVHRYEIPPLVVACSTAPDRTRDYAANPDHARFVVEELLPFLEDRWPLRRRPADRCLMGASLGAVASLYAAWRHPGAFGRLLLQSGSFAFTDVGRQQHGPLFDPIVGFVNGFRAVPDRPVESIFVSCGVYESLIYENRSLVSLLQSTDMDVRYVEARDGHNWENWRDRLREGLSWLFPGPLGLVYE